ncbi:MAG TPA: hypothetical protein VHF06_07400 [Pseudonocardiaceae bacterium]|jgi:hypothetical protein|nr:hypothetical protein [Pseudonocardiaceae bacterium]
MNRLRAIATGVGVAACLAIPATAANATTAPSASGGAITVQPNSVDAFNCESGYVCLYSNTTALEEGNWALRYLTYGVHPFYDEYGDQWLDNNQTGGAVFRLCYNSNGTNCTGPYAPGYAYEVDLTPFNSIVLSKS